MSIKNLTLIAGCVLGLSGIASAFPSYNTCRDLVRAHPEREGKISILNVVGGGSGCGNLSAADWRPTASISSDREAFTVFYDDFYVDTSRSRSSCSFAVKLCVPTGIKVSLAEVSNMGVYSLQSDNMAISNSTRYFVQGWSGSGLNYNTTIRKYRGVCYQYEGRTYKGPVDCAGTYESLDRFGLVSYVWSECGASKDLNVSNSLQISGARTDEDYFQFDLTDGRFRDLYTIAYFWSRQGCN